MSTNLIEDEIVSIEAIGSIETVDICVSDDNYFIANEILTHNSGYNVSSPGLNTVSESIALAATADAMMSIYQDDTDRQLGVIKLGIMKNRFGANFGECALKIDYKTLTITEDSTVNSSAASTSSINTLAALCVDKKNNSTK